jgi:predicted dehydrogenase
MKMRDDVVPPDYFEMLFYYDKLRVRLKATCICRESPAGYMLHGMKGSFIQQRSDMQEQELLAGTVPTLETWCPGPPAPDGLLHTEINGQATRREQTSSPGNYMGFYDDLHKFLTGSGANPVPPEDGILTIRIIEATLLSMKERRVVEL